MEDKEQLTEQESIRIISEMMIKVRKDFYDTGVSALLWGSVITFCGIFSFLGSTFKWSFGYYNVWNLTFFAVFPQVWIAIKERRSRKVKDNADSGNVIWMVFALTMFGLVFYSFNVTAPSKMSSLYLLIYAVPTITTGIVRKFKPMINGSIICYACFIISFYVPNNIIMLLQAIAGCSCWLIPGIILHQRYKKSRR